VIGPVLGFDRETLMIAALASVSAAGVVVSVTAWVLLLRERRGRRGSAP
jgi:hypothetical protein